MGANDRFSMKIKFKVNFVEIIEILCNQCCFNQLVNPLTFNDFQTRMNITWAGLC